MHCLIKSQERSYITLEFGETVYNETRIIEHMYFNAISNIMLNGKLRRKFY
jgi:hypothetical protein